MNKVGAFISWQIFSETRSDLVLSDQNYFMHTSINNEFFLELADNPVPVEVL